MTRKQLARQALEKSLEVREEYSYDFRSPLCVYELADRAGVKVQFVNDVSMEGVYAAFAKPTVCSRPSVHCPAGPSPAPTNSATTFSATDQRSTSSKMTSQIGRFSPTSFSQTPLPDSS